MRKVGCLVVIIGLIVTAGISVCVWFNGGGVEPPGVNSAPYIVQTPSRAYYAKDVLQQGDNVVIHGYWDFDGEEWQFADRVLLLTKNYGEVTVERRKTK